MAPYDHAGSPQESGGEKNIKKEGEDSKLDDAAAQRFQRGALEDDENTVLPGPEAKGDEKGAGKIGEKPRQIAAAEDEKARQDIMPVEPSGIGDSDRKVNEGDEKKERYQLAESQNGGKAQPYIPFPGRFDS